jgi:ABC-2 type transport system ATP-binding protein
VRFGAPPGLDVAGLGATLGALVTEEVPGEYVVACRPEPAVVAELTGWLASHDIPLADLRAGRRRLEDIYLALTNRTAAPPPAPAVARRARRRGRPSP